MGSVSGSDFHQELLFAFGGGDRNVTIAVLDGPVDRTHDCFVGAPLTPLHTAVMQRSGDDAPSSAQSTHLASLIFGQPCRSVEGIAPMCRGLIAPIFGDSRPVCAQADLADAITRALDHGAQILLIGAGSFEQPWYPSPALARAIARCNIRNAMIVASAGRYGCSTLLRRCGTLNLLPVTALDGVGQPLGGNDGNLSDIGIAVPGSSVSGAALEGRVVQRSHPNVAAALVTGAAALLLGVQRNAGLAPNPAAVAEAVRMTATPQTSPSGSALPPAWTGRKNLEAAAAYLTGRYEGAYASGLFEAWYRARAGATRSDHAAFRPRA
ncbi:peptidase [Rhodopseudomonas palustris]|uniref:Peptidase n=1 Tax=Rhodopseudomonas palustris TaxID=1076 RepID=A0A323UED8_RHOPL|nr:S8 family serine peptidase [Rhodopseudomonas palustris]PZA10533.1 peptidase [Rhodopseudomonas palustris]